jgi:hypothetical protein
MQGSENDPFGLMGSADPFAEPAPAPAPVASAPPAGTPPAGTPPAGAVPPLSTPGFVPVEDFQKVKGELDALKPLAWIGEAMQRDPSISARLQQTLFSGPGAPPVVGPTPAQAAEAQQAELQQRIAAKMAAGDVVGAIAEATNMGMSMAEAKLRAEIGSAAAPLMSMTAMNAIENWKNAKRSGPAGAIFAKIESKFNALIALTPQATLANLAQTGQLGNALEMTYNTVLSKTYEEAYTKASADGRIQRQDQPVPSYGAPAGGGPIPTDDLKLDKEDEEFVAAGEARGIKFSRNGTSLFSEAT